jgi:hypothetical protein
VIEGRSSLLPCDGVAWLEGNALAASDADRLFDELTAGIDWRQEIARVMGRRVPIPRLTAWHGEAGYVYSGIRMTPAPWSPPLLEIKAIAEACAGQAFNSVLLNLYRAGRGAALPDEASRLRPARIARSAARLVPGHGRSDPAPLAAPGAEDRSSGRAADQSHLSDDARGGVIARPAGHLPVGRRRS